MRRTFNSASIEFLVDQKTETLLAFEYGFDAKNEFESKEILRLSLDDVRSRDPSEIRRSIGRLVLSFLNSRSTAGLGLPRDLEDDDNLDDEYLSQLSLAAQSGEPESIFNMATALIARGMTNENWSDIERGEKFLNQVVEIGFPAAREYHSDTWALIRPRLEKKFKPTR